MLGQRPHVIWLAHSTETGTADVVEALSLSSWDRFVVVLPGGPVPPDAGEGSAWAWWTGVLGRGVVKPLFLVLCVGLVEFATRSPLPGWFAFFPKPM